MDQANWALAHYLAGAGHETHLVGYFVSDDLASHPNINVHQVERIANSYFLSEPRLQRAGMRVGREIKARGGFVVANGGNCPFPDVNWVHYVHAAFAPRSSGPVHVRVALTLQHRVYCRQEAAALHKARLIFANSEGSRRALIDGVGIAPGNVQLLYYGSAVERFAPVAEAERQALRQREGLSGVDNVFLYAGALGDLRKGFDRLFAAWKIAQGEMGGRAALAVVGMGREVPAWRARAEREGLDIRFLGFRQDIENVFRACDALVLPARYEPFGLVVQEALCCGVPAIVSREVGAAEVFTEELRPLVVGDADDPRQLADRLIEVGKDRRFYRDAALRFREQISGYGWEQMAQRMVKRIEQ